MTTDKTSGRAERMAHAMWDAAAKRGWETHKLSFVEWSEAPPDRAEHFRMLARAAEEVV